MFGLSFGEPWSLTLIAVIAPLWWFWRFERRRRAAADQDYGGAAELRLGQRAGRQRLRMWFLGAAVVLVVIALARPQWGSADAPAERRGVDVLIALDVSRSMTTSDVLPARSVAAAEGIGDFLTHLRSDRVGLVIFSGRAFERSPLTLDLEALGQLVNQAQRDSELVGRGTDVGAAIDEALSALDVPDAAESQLILVVSDGEDLGEAATAAAARAEAADIPIFTVAVGTDGGASIPGDDASLAVSRADREALRAIATSTGGDFRELDAIAGLAIEVQRLRQSAFSDDTGRQPIERFQWFLVPALVLLVLPILIGEAAGTRTLSRRHLGALTVLGALMLGACGGSQLYQHVEDGNAAYGLAFYDDALVNYRDASLIEPGAAAVRYNVGNTLHQLRRFEEASVASADALGRVQDDTLADWLRYALGNHAVERGALEEARRHYIDVLRSTPDDTDAKANLELVLAQLEPPPVIDPPPTDVSPPVDQPPGGQPGGEQPGAGDGTPPPDDGGDDEPGDGDDPSQQPGGGDEPGDPADDPGGSDPADGEPGQPGDPGDGDGDPGGNGANSGGDAPGVLLSVEEARAALNQALEELAGGELTLEEAVALLDLIRQLSEVEPLDPTRSGRGGGFADR